ncbi:repressor LexA [Enterococcus sp. PF1-24]|uniref:helix-turn-helix domain-containing protein n=1 Tax=unclassified Enterococcus TaxID=2608891 RepID=UPI0024742574|nr:MULTISPECIES: XRE family transcriptional regulator [unclassified Enterococcus]MDH6363702.1 repressor LexA [Enterococcus sp. PFB1-1]MDH6400658.1 repressor LexA [Enterococcus sp. PF1-24]
MSVGERMKQRRKELGISADIVAKKLSVSRSTIFRYEKGDIEKLPTKILDDIADVLKTTPAYLMGWTDDTADILPIYKKLNKKRKNNVYVFATKQLEEQQLVVEENTIEFPTKEILNGRSTAAGTPLDGDLQDENTITMIVSQRDIPKNADEIVTIAGDSMEPDYKKGTQVFVHWQPEVENGEVAIIAIADEGVTCKKIHYDWEQGKIILRSINDKYADMIYPMKNIRIIGKVL